MKAKYLIIIPLVVIVALKILISIVTFLFSRTALLAILGIGLAVKTGLVSVVYKFFNRKKPSNNDTIIEVEPIKLD